MKSKRDSSPSRDESSSDGPPPPKKIKAEEMELEWHEFPRLDRRGRDEQVFGPLDLRYMLSKPETHMYDVVVIVIDEKSKTGFKLHKTLLEARCPYFHDAFKKHRAQFPLPVSQFQTITIRRAVTSKAFQLIIPLFYGGSEKDLSAELKTFDDCIVVIKAAGSLQLPSVRSLALGKAVAFIQASVGSSALTRARPLSYYDTYYGGADSDSDDFDYYGGHGYDRGRYGTGGSYSRHRDYRLAASYGGGGYYGSSSSGSAQIGPGQHWKALENLNTLFSLSTYKECEGYNSLGSLIIKSLPAEKLLKLGKDDGWLDKKLRDRLPGMAKGYKSKKDWAASVVDMKNGMYYGSVSRDMWLQIEH